MHKPEECSASGHCLNQSVKGFLEWSATTQKRAIKQKSMQNKRSSEHRPDVEFHLNFELIEQAENEIRLQSGSSQTLFPHNPNQKTEQFKRNDLGLQRKTLNDGENSAE
eukprot:c47133_g1_i1 orf=60-386(+)